MQEEVYVFGPSLFYLIFSFLFSSLDFPSYSSSIFSAICRCLSLFHLFLSTLFYKHIQLYFFPLLSSPLLSSPIFSSLLLILSFLLLVLCETRLRKYILLRILLKILFSPISPLSYLPFPSPIFSSLDSLTCIVLGSLLRTIQEYSQPPGNRRGIYE